MLYKGSDLLKENRKKNIKYDQELKQVNVLDTARVYQRSEELFYPSVTTVLSYLPKGKFFEQWLKDVGSNADLIAGRAAKEGTQVHDAMEDLIAGKTIEWINQWGKANYSEFVWGMILKGAEFLNTVKPVHVATEEFLFSDTHHYAGAADYICEINGETWLIDFKTSKQIHKSMHFQLSAYAKAWEEIYGKKIDKTGILWFKSHKRGPSNKEGVYQGKGWELVEVNNVEENFEKFMLIKQLFDMDNPNISAKVKTYPTEIKLDY